MTATVTRYEGAGHGFVQHFSWIPEYHRASRRPRSSCDERDRSTPLVSPWGRFGLYSFFIDAPEPAIVDTGIASSPAEGIVAGAGGYRPPRSRTSAGSCSPTGTSTTSAAPTPCGSSPAGNAKVVIHEADAPMLRSRRAHVQEYLDGRAAICTIPRARPSRPR